jgi:hypothetical protein
MKQSTTIAIKTEPSFHITPSNDGSFGLSFRVKRMIRVVSDTLDDPQALGFTLPEQDSIARSQEFRPLDEPEGNKSSITGSNEGAVNVDDRASLTHCADV